jgi:hypothetical protein
MANPTTNFGWQMPTSTDLVTDLPADFEVFGQAVDTSLVDLKGGTTGQVLSKTSNTDMDFTWVTTDDANAIQNSIVDAKGDLIAASANDTPARLAVGNNGETLVADSSTSTGLRWNATQSGGKNKCVNGGMDFFQRSTSNATTGYQTADRWYQLIAGTTTVSRDTDVPSGVPVQYSLKGLTSAGTSYMQYQYSLESADVIPLRGLTVTFSWYMKKNSTWSGLFGESNYYYSNSTDARASLGTNVSAGYSNPTGVTPTTSWARYYETITIPSDAVGFQKQFNPSTVQASGAALWITGVQIEIGTSPTTFTRAGGTIQGELAACQRYYFRNTANADEILINYAFAASSGFANGQIQYPVTMRVVPTAIETSNIKFVNYAGSSFTMSSIGFNERSASAGQVYGSVSGATAGHTGKVMGSATGAYVGISAEL